MIESETERKHTPLPWRSRLVMNQMDNQGSTICAFGGYQGSPRWMMFSPHMPGDTEADAKFADLACNSHYELLAACDACKTYWLACAESCNEVEEEPVHPSCHRATDLPNLAKLANLACEKVFAAIAKATP